MAGAGGGDRLATSGTTAPTEQVSRVGPERPLTAHKPSRAARAERSAVRDAAILASSYHHQVVYEPAAIVAGVPPYAVALAERARGGGLAIYAGAGVSRAEPAGLPTGAQAAQRIHSRLRGAFPVLADVDDTDLVAIADAVAMLDGGEEALRFSAVQVAEFTTATPTYGHCILALLLLEGVVDVLTTNWDNCIERAGAPERVQSVITAQDRLHVVGRSVLKIHGCATQPESLLLTSEHLASPPSWVTDETRARLGSAIVVFVGIGDVAGYVEKRLSEAIADIGAIDNIRVVGPNIVDEWQSSQWSLLVPNLPNGFRVAETADAFLDKLGAAYIHVSLADLAARLEDAPTIAAAFTAAAKGIRLHDALTVLAWTRRAGVVSQGGTSTLNTEAMAEVIAALGRLAGDEIRIERDGTLATRAGRFEVLVSVGALSASRLQREARNRLARHVGNGAPEPTFLVAGGIGWVPTMGAHPADILDEDRPNDILDGPGSVMPRIMRAQDVLVA